MLTALLLCVAAAHADPLPSWAVERVGELLDQGAAPLVAATGPSPEGAAAEVRASLGVEAHTLRGAEPLAALEALMAEAGSDCGVLLEQREAGTWSLRRRGLCGRAPPPPPPPPPPPVPEPEPEPEPPPTYDPDAPPPPARVIVRFAEFRIGGSGASWSAGSSIDVGLDDTTSIGGSVLVAVKGYLGTDARLSFYKHQFDTAHGPYARFDLGASSALAVSGASISGLIAAGPGWRIRTTRPGERGLFGVLDLGIMVRLEAGTGGVPYGGANVGTSFSISGGFGL